MRFERAANPQFQMKIEAVKTVPYGRVAEFMAIVQHAGVVNLSFVTIRQQRELSIYLVGAV